MKKEALENCGIAGLTWVLLLIISMALISLLGVEAVGQQQRCGTKPKIGFEYDIVENTKTASPPNVRSLRVVLKAKYFNDTHIRLLAKSIRSLFCEDTEISALIFDDLSVAKRIRTDQFLLGKFRPPEVRGIYALSDEGKIESIEYSTRRGNPIDEIVLRLTP